MYVVVFFLNIVYEKPVFVQNASTWCMANANWDILYSYILVSTNVYDLIVILKSCRFRLLLLLLFFYIFGRVFTFRQIKGKSNRKWDFILFVVAETSKYSTAQRSSNWILKRNLLSVHKISGNKVKRFSNRRNSISTNSNWI